MATIDIAYAGPDAPPPPALKEIFTKAAAIDMQSMLKGSAGQSGVEKV